MDNKYLKPILFLGLLVFALVYSLPTIMQTTTFPQWWPAKRVNLGLDIRGGSYIVMSVDTKEAVKSNMTRLARVLKEELRDDDFPIVKSRPISNGQYGVDLRFIKPVAISEVSASVQAEWPFLQTTQVGQSNQISYLITQKRKAEIESNSVEQAIEKIRNRVDQYGVAEPTIQRLGLNSINVQLPDVKDMSKVKELIGTVARLDFQFVSNSPGDESIVYMPLREGGQLGLDPEIPLSGDSVQDARVQIDPVTNEIGVSLKFTPDGAKVFDRITADNVGRSMAIVLDSVVQSAPVIRERISQGVASITGNFNAEEARQLAVVLRSGALPAPLKIEAERTVGPSLGKDSITKGLLALSIGALIVIGFIIVYYKKAGLLSVACLLFNLILLLGFLVFYEATLTLPGLAGLVLTVGMAVDANVIIYERIKEELIGGAGRNAAIRAGFSKAHWTVMDANITTLLTGLILFTFGTGPIQGFAVTLCLGILTSVFSALVVSRMGFAAFKLSGGKYGLSI